jgi:SAM-dependent methyltransferase
LIHKRIYVKTLGRQIIVRSPATAKIVLWLGMANTSLENAPAAESDILWQKLQGDFPIGSEPHARGQPRVLDLPNAALRESSSDTDLGNFYAIGEAWAQLAISLATTDAPRVVDIGCGCGKMARFFVMNPKVQYLGLDVFGPAVAWCREAFQHFPSFRFEHLDVYSSVYNPSGAMQPEVVVLPIADATADVVICASLFTHLLESAFVRYLGEVARILAPNGRALISIHDEPKEGSFSGDAARIDMDRPYFVEAATATGLLVTIRIGAVYGQQVYVLSKSGN